MSAERSLLIRPARRGEEEELTELAVRSKSHWQYPVEQVEAWRPDLTISAETLSSLVVYVAQIDDRICGFFALLPDSSSRWEVEHLWVEPNAIGQGVGKALLGFASRYAAEHGATALSIDADPNAEAFYGRAARYAWGPRPRRSGRIRCGSGRECTSPSGSPVAPLQGPKPMGSSMAQRSRPATARPPRVRC